MLLNKLLRLQRIDDAHRYSRQGNRKPPVGVRPSSPDSLQPSREEETHPYSKLTWYSDQVCVTKSVAMVTDSELR